MARQILITGGTSGIGAGIAAAFAAQGDQVTVTGATAAEVDAATGRAGTTAQVLDVRDGAAVQALVATLGPLDVVVNCAGEMTSVRWPMRSSSRLVASIVRTTPSQSRSWTPSDPCACSSSG
jgi:NAD(P)-dependent dehydrogenase (short-subunit alcohol dehydrogenase family)